MLLYRLVQRDANEVAECTCNKCGKTWTQEDPSRPQFTRIRKTYGHGSPKDGDKYVSDICEPCMDLLYTEFAVPPQVVGMVEWGEEPPDPVRYVGMVEWEPATPAAPVAPAGEDHEPQTQEA